MEPWNKVVCANVAGKACDIRRISNTSKLWGKEVAVSLPLAAHCCEFLTLTSLYISPGVYSH